MPQFVHKFARSFSIEKAGNVYLHITAIWKARLFKLIDNILIHNLIVQAKADCYLFLNPRFDHIEVHLFDVHLCVEYIGKFKLFQKLLVFVRKAIVLVGASATKETRVSHDLCKLMTIKTKNQITGKYNFCPGSTQTI